jgi:hypothetical protein
VPETKSKERRFDSFQVQMNLMTWQKRPKICQSRDDFDGGEMRTKSKESAVGDSKPMPVRFSPDQVQQVQEAIRRAERDMTDWREKSRVDPEKIKQPLTR